MPEETVKILTRDGRMETFVAYPEPPACERCVLLFHDNPGPREELRVMARRLAAHGFVAVLPDLYYRSGRIRVGFPMQRDEWLRVRDARDQSTMARFRNDVDALVGHLASDERADPSRLGALGLCIGSGYAMALAAQLGPRVAALALVDPCEESDRTGSPLRFRDASQTHALFVHAADYSREQGQAMLAQLEGAGAPCEVEVLADTAHGFAFRDWTFGEYSEPGASAAWERTLAHLERWLR